MVQPAPGATAPAPSSQPAPVADPPKDDKPHFEISWQNGIWYQTANKDFTYHIGGTVQYDADVSRQPVYRYGQNRYRR